MRLALLTGGSKGLGLALCEVLAGRGFRVVEFSRTAPHAHSVRVDLSSPQETQRVVAETIATIDPLLLDELIVVANAATLEPIGPSHRKNPEAIVANLNTNLVSAVLFVSLSMARFQSAACRKVIANVSAGGAQNGVFGWSLYCAAKAGMENFVRSLALEQQGESYPFIPVNIDPGVVDTDMHVVAGAAPLSDFPAAGRFAERKAKGLLTAPATVAVALAHLLELPSLASGGHYDVREVEA